MTAVGLFLLLIAFFGAWLNDVVLIPDWLGRVLGFAAVIGFVMFMAGLFTWIWQVMP
jgi:hypothetical protein